VSTRLIQDAEVGAGEVGNGKRGDGACPERAGASAPAGFPRMTRGVATVVLKAAWLR